jgi:MerR family mercuric resistance operon transcriptional regulator
VIESMTIGGAARAAGVSVETIRFYQRRGLIDEPAKPFGGLRRYPPEVVNRICFIKRAQVLGFSLDEVATLLRLDSARACAETRDLALVKLAMIERKLADLEHMRDALTTLVARCEPEQAGADCPIIESLTTGE